jgi:putative sigma-54 modulation protein
MLVIPLARLGGPATAFEQTGARNVAPSIEDRMKIQIRDHSIEITAAIRTHVARRLRFALGRFAPRIEDVVVRFSETSRGHHAGVDNRCQIDVSLHHARSAIVEQTDGDLFAAVDRAAARASRVVARALERARESSPPPPRAIAR